MAVSTAQDGFIYIFRNDRLHNEIKVGLSKNPFKRVMQLYTTATATPMNISVIWWVSDMRSAERIAHNRLADHRINRMRPKRAALASKRKSRSGNKDLRNKEYPCASFALRQGWTSDGQYV